MTPARHRPEAVESEARRGLLLPSMALNGSLIGDGRSVKTVPTDRVGVQVLGFGLFEQPRPNSRGMRCCTPLTRPPVSGRTDRPGDPVAAFLYMET